MIKMTIRGVLRMALAVSDSLTEGAIMKIWFAAAIYVGMMCAGCSSVQDMWQPAPPQTRAKYGAFSGFEFFDTKNNDVDLDAQYNPQTGEYRVIAKIRNNASDVNESMVPLMQQFILGMSARVDQMDARTREIEQHGKNISEALSGLRGLLETGLAPLRGLKVGVDTPIGSGSVETGGNPN